MKRFNYLSDPLFLAGCSCYLVNRWLLKPRVHLPFLHNYFNDCFLIPCALPPILLLHRRLRLRDHDRKPTWLEVAAHLAVWSLLFEYFGPHLFSWTTGDLGDVAAYAGGALVSMVVWHW